MGVLALGCATHEVRRFSDRPVAWDEHDDAHVPRAPREDQWQRLRWTHGMKDLVVREVDRQLALEWRRPAEDVNALDEVPCSEWFCPRNHLEPLRPEEVTAGPPDFAPPEPPFRLVKVKKAGAAPGFIGVDRRGRKFLIKFDPPGHLNMHTGAEVVITRLFHAAGYWVPGTWVLDVEDGDFLIDDPGDVPPKRLRAVLDWVQRAPDGRVRMLATSFIPGKILGGFDFMGRRGDDPNDRIRHERRRSLRASWMLYAWTAVGDAGAANTVDAWQERDGRRFVRHYIVDFGAGLGSWTRRPKPPNKGAEYAIEVSRTLRALFSLGAYRRDWQDDLPEWQRFVPEHPEVGWFPAESWNPAKFRTVRKVPAHLRMTDRDAYWGAKVVTSFTDEQIRAAVRAARYSGRDAAYLEHALAVRRDKIGQRWLTRVTALERPWLEPGYLCFEDLAIARRAARATDVRYRWRVDEADGSSRAEAIGPAHGAKSCLPVGSGRGAYRIVTVRSEIAGRAAKATQVHLAWRPAERRFVVVGVERDE